MELLGIAMTAALGGGFYAVALLVFNRENLIGALRAWVVLTAFFLIVGLVGWGLSGGYDNDIPPWVAEPRI